jgi:5'-3' exonuclease
VTKKAKPRLLAFDGNYVIMRSNYAFRDLSVGDQPSGAVYGYVKTFQDLLQSYQPEVLLPLFDNGRSSYRLAISEHYKENRGKKDDKLVNQIRACHEFVELTGLKPYIEKNTEADDLAAKTAKDCHEDYFVMLYSKDHDWQQLTGEDVVFMRPKGRGDGIDIISYDKAKEDIFTSKLLPVMVFRIQHDKVVFMTVFSCLCSKIICFCVLLYIRFQACQLYKLMTSSDLIY